MKLGRRAFLRGAAVTAGAIGSGLVGKRIVTDLLTTPDEVCVLSAESYRRDLVGLLKPAIEHFVGDRVVGARCLIKPNMVEFIPGAPVNTEPAVLAATAEALISLGAKAVQVGEGPGHRRDISYMLKRSGYLDVLDTMHLDYVDLNLDDTEYVVAPRNATGFGGLHIPRAVLDADIVVSLAKMKLHKWVGATLSMKNLFGCAPSAVYGWPKNTLHWAGISNSITDLNDIIAPELCIIDGIVGMEGYAPIQGDPVAHGVLVVGARAAAVDATACRVMGIEPAHIGYLKTASGRHGNIADRHIDMVAEPWRDLRKDYRLMKEWKKLRLS
jgi:uncharacterized protein (DUF362 family)